MKNNKKYGIATIGYYEKIDNNNLVCYKEIDRILFDSIEGKKEIPIFVEIFEQEHLIYEYFTGVLLGTTDILKNDNCYDEDMPMSIVSINLLNNSVVNKYIGDISLTDIINYVTEFKKIRRLSMEFYDIKKKKKKKI